MLILGGFENESVKSKQPLMGNGIRPVTLESVGCAIICNFPTTFQNVMQCDAEAIVRAGTELVSLILTLAHIIDASAYIDSENYSVCLSLRTEALKLLLTISQIMIGDRDTFERGK